jgi:hypothetical protein
MRTPHPLQSTFDLMRIASGVVLILIALRILIRWNALPRRMTAQLTLGAHVLGRASFRHALPAYVSLSSVALRLSPECDAAHGRPASAVHAPIADRHGVSNAATRHSAEVGTAFMHAEAAGVRMSGEPAAARAESWDCVQVVRMDFHQHVGDSDCAVRTLAAPRLQNMIR